MRPEAWRHKKPEMNSLSNVTQYFSFQFFHIATDSYERGKKLFPVVQIWECVSTSVAFFFSSRRGCMMCFSVCYLSDVSLLNELYWHLGDISMNMTLDFISITLARSLCKLVDCTRLQSLLCGLPSVVLSLPLFFARSFR